MVNYEVDPWYRRAGKKALAVGAAAALVVAGVVIADHLTDDSGDTAAPREQPTESHPLPLSPEASKNFEMQWQQLAAKVRSFADTVQPDNKSVVVKRGRSVFGGSSGGDYIEVQTDVYNPSTHALQEYVIETVTPDAATQDGSVAPNSLFQITLFEATVGDNPPSNPDDFNKAINESHAPTKYLFNLVKESEGQWTVTTNYGHGDLQQYSTGAPATATQSAVGNNAYANMLVSQAADVLGVAQAQKPVDQKYPEVLDPNINTSS